MKKWMVFSAAFVFLACLEMPALGAQPVARPQPPVLKEPPTCTITCPATIEVQMEAIANAFKPLPSGWSWVGGTVTNHTLSFAGSEMSSQGMMQCNYKGGQVLGSIRQAPKAGEVCAKGPAPDCFACKKAQ